MVLAGLMENIMSKTTMCNSEVSSHELTEDDLNEKTQLTEEELKKVSGGGLAGGLVGGLFNVPNDHHHHHHGHHHHVKS
jgi:bacteriocin-like protein